MDNAAQISEPLKRPLQSGAKYNRLLPNVSCAATPLGDGSNNTIEGVEFMADWIAKYSWQTKQLTQQLLQEGKISQTDLQKTVNGIYSFLYRHVQYKADGSLQQLRSPACTWEQRKTGVDCKSYTIFAMAMLQNLGITAAIRQVKQPGFYPDQFTHVYVVVPKNQNTKNRITGSYYVIDATKHTNVEGEFLEAKDKIMSGLKYQGLNAPSQNGLGLSRTRLRKLSTKKREITEPVIKPSPDVHQTIGTTSAALKQARNTYQYKNFEYFLGMLEGFGFSSKTSTAIKNYVDGILADGKTPYFHLDALGILIRPNPEGGGVFFKRTTGLTGLNGYDTGTYMGGDGTGTTTTNQSGEGIDWEAVGEAFENIWNSLEELFSVHPSCWGGSAYEAQSLQADLDLSAKVFKKYLGEVKDASQTQDFVRMSDSANIFMGLAKLFNKVYASIEKQPQWRSHCTIDNLATIVGYSEDALAIANALKSWLNKYYTVENTGSISLMFGTYFKDLWPVPEDSWTVSVPDNQYRPKDEYVPSFDPVFGDEIPDSGNNTDTGTDTGNDYPGNTNGDYDAGNYDPGNTDQGNYDPVNTPGTTGNNKTLVYGGLVLGGLLLFWPTIAKSVEPKKTAKKPANKSKTKKLKK